MRADPAVIVATILVVVAFAQRAEGIAVPPCFLLNDETMCSFFSCQWINGACTDQAIGCGGATDCLSCSTMIECIWDGTTCIDYIIEDDNSEFEFQPSEQLAARTFQQQLYQSCGPICSNYADCANCNAANGCGWSGSNCLVGASQQSCTPDCTSIPTCDACLANDGCAWVEFDSDGSTMCLHDGKAGIGNTELLTCSASDQCEVHNSCFDCLDNECYWVNNDMGFPVCSGSNSDPPLLTDQGGCQAYCEEGTFTDCESCSRHGCYWGSDPGDTDMGIGCYASSVTVPFACPVCEHFDSCYECRNDHNDACAWGSHETTGALGCHPIDDVTSADHCSCQYSNCGDCQSSGCFWGITGTNVAGASAACESRINYDICQAGCVDGTVGVGPFVTDGGNALRLAATEDPIEAVTSTQSLAQYYYLRDASVTAFMFSVLAEDEEEAEAIVFEIWGSDDDRSPLFDEEVAVEDITCESQQCVVTLAEPYDDSSFWVILSTTDSSASIAVLGVPPNTAGLYGAGSVAVGLTTIDDNGVENYALARAGTLASWGLIAAPECCVEECAACAEQLTCGDCADFGGCAWWYSPNGGVCLGADADPASATAGDIDDSHPAYFAPFTTSSCCFDADGDGIPTCPANTVCEPSCPADLSIDCDDSAESGFAVHPYAEEVSCDSVDNDCDSETPDHLVEITFDGGQAFNEPTSDDGEVACANFRVRMSDGCVSSSTIRVDLEVSPASAGDTAVAGFHYVDDDDLHVVFVSRNNDVRAGLACVALVNNDVDEVDDLTTLTVRITAAYTVDSDGIRNDRHPVGIATGKRQITASILDTDQAEWIVSSPTRVFVDEDGSAATMTVRPATQPIESVTMATGSSNTEEGVVTPSMLAFTAQDWTTAKTITISGVDDGEDDGAETFELLLFSVSTGSADDSLYGEDVLDEEICFTNEGLGGDASLIPVLEIVDIKALSAKLEWTTIPSAVSYLVVANYEGGRARLYQAPAKEGANPLYQSLQVSIPQQAHVLFSVQPIFSDGSLGTLSIGRDTAMAKSGGRAVDGELFENGDSSLTFGSSSPSNADGSPVYGGCAPVQEANEGSLSCVVVGNLSPNLDVGGSKRSWLTREVDGVRWWSVSVVDGVSEALYILIIDDFDPDECPSASFTVSATGNVREVVITGASPK